MKRRNLLALLPWSDPLYGSVATVRSQECSSCPAANYSSVPAVLPGDAESYFTDDKLRALVDSSRPLPATGYQVAVYYYPCWHPCPWFEKHFGKGWTQFQSLRDAKPLYPGHLFPKYPLWGEYDESDPAWAAREIETAADYGIHAWMICWYWHEGTQRCQLQLERGFLKAPNNHRIKFALMWANHDWRNHWPAASDGQTALMSRQRHSEQDMLRVVEYCIEHYFRRPNYWRMPAGPVFGIYSVESLLRDLSPEQCRRALARMREEVAKAGLGDLHLMACSANPTNAPKLRDLGFQSATLYHTFTPLLQDVPRGGRAPYGRLAAQAVSYWRRLRAACSVPFFPSCSVGWDNSPRVGRSARMVTQRTADQFERLMLAAKHHLAEAAGNLPNVVFLSSWNEWTEDHVLLPDTVYGYSYLEAVRRVFVERQEANAA